MHPAPAVGAARVRATLALAIVGAALSGCRAGGEGGDGTLIVVHRLLQSAGGAAPDTPRTCALADETRPARGCAPVTILPTQKNVVPEELPVRRRYALPPPLVGRDCILEPMYKASNAPAWTPLPPVLRPRAAGEIEELFALPDALARGPVDLWLQARPTAPLEQTFETPPVTVPRGAILDGGIGIETVGSGTRGSPVTFRLVAETSRGEMVLLERVLEARSEPGASGWTGYRVDLGPLAGEAVRFRFSSQVRSTPGLEEDDRFRFPLWGVADVLAPARRARRRNLILLSLDTMRADHVGAYGCDLPTTPTLDRLAADGTLFERAITTYPATTAAHMSMLTGLYPTGHEVVGPLASLQPMIPTLAELLAAQGYETAAVTEDGMVSIASGFARGFSRYREFKGATAMQTFGHIGDVVDTALGWVTERRDTPFFLFLHTYQVHGPYTPPPGFDLFQTYRVDGKEQPITAETPEEIRSRYAYAGEVRYADSEIARLLEGLSAAGAADDTVVVVTGDHGEAFSYKHGMLGHGWNVYEDVLRVPLIMRAPGLVPAGRRVRELASLVDIVPTVLDLLGVPIPPTVQGASLVPLMRQDSVPAFADRAVFAEVRRGNERHVACEQGRRKWIIDTASGSGHVYDLVADPGEDHDLATPALLAEGRALLARYEEGSERVRRAAGAAQPVAATPDQRTVEKLRALGYVR